MPDRAALLLSCSSEEARIIRERAKLQHRGISSYMLDILTRALQFEDRLLAKGGGVYSLYKNICRTPDLPLGPRTTMLLRCSAQESERIRWAAKMRDTTISEFVLHCLRRSWLVEKQPRPKPILANQVCLARQPLCGDPFGAIRPFSTDGD